jgi:integrase
MAPRRNLTDKGVDALKVRKTRYMVSDPGQPQHYVRVAPSGRKTFMLVTYSDTGKQIWRQIGIADEMTIEHARSEARKALRSIKLTVGGPVTFGDVAEQWLRRHVEQKGLRSHYEITRHLKRNILPLWGDKDFASIKRSDVAKLLDAIEERNSARQADYVLAIVRAIFRWYEARHDDYVSPVTPGMRRTNPKDRERARTLLDDEIRAVWNAASGPYGDLVKLLLLTGQRREKVAAMRWQDIDGDIWNIPTEGREKGNGGALTLPTEALAIIKAQERFDHNPYVFTGRGAVPMSGWNKRKRALDQVSGVSDWVLHDLRRTARSLMSRAGVKPHIAERVVGHKLQGVEGVYDRHQYAEEKAAALQSLAGLIALILNPSGKVVKLKRA